MSFLDREGGELAGIVADLVERTAARRDLSLSHELQRLDLAAIDQLPDEDFVAIRMQSEDFGEFRGVLERALHGTRDHAQRGGDWQRAFRANLEEVRWRAELLRRDVKDKAVTRYLRQKSQGYTIGALSGATFALSAGLVTGELAPAMIAAQFGISIPLSTLISLLFRQRTDRPRRLLRFYNVLLDEPEQAAAQ